MLETVVTKTELLQLWDQIAKGLHQALKKIGDGNQTPQQVMYQMAVMVGTPHGFLLVSKDEHNRLDGLLWAVANVENLVSPIIEISIFWAKPGVGKRELYRGFDMLLVWAKGLGATDVYIGVLRSPKILMKHFYAKLGFEAIGYIARRRI